MAKYFIIEKNLVTSYHCTDDDKHLLVIPQSNDNKKGDISIGDANCYSHYFEDSRKEEITENEFLTAVGNITASIQNFIDKTRIS